MKYNFCYDVQIIAKIFFKITPLFVFKFQLKIKKIRVPLI